MEDYAESIVGIKEIRRGENTEDLEKYRINCIENL